MTKNTTVMVWYIALLMIAWAGLWHSPNENAFSNLSASALGARNIQISMPTDYSNAPSSARIILNGVEYEASLSRVPSYTY